MSNVKTITVPANNHGTIFDTLVINKDSISVNYETSKATANVVLAPAASVVNGKVISQQVQGQPPRQTGFTRQYQATVTAFDEATVTAAIWAVVSSVAGYTYVS